MSSSPESPRRWMVRFFTIWTGQQFSLVGSSVVQFALVWWLTKTTGSATILATASMVAMIPGVVLGPLVGALVDRWNRKAVMIVADSISALAAAWVVYLFWTGAIQPWHVYIIMAIRSIAGTFHWPAMMASTTLMVPETHLARISGLNQMMFGVSNIVSPPLGALCMALLPLHGVMMIDVVTAALAIIPLLMVTIPQPTRVVAPAAQGKPSVWAEMVAGLRYVWHWPGLKLLLLMALGINFFCAPTGALAPILITKYFKGEAGEMATFNSLWGVGVIAGGLVLSAWGGFKRRMVTSLTGLIFMGLGCLIIGLTPARAFWLALVGNFITGFFNPICNGPIMAVLQVSVAPEMQGRVFTLVGSVCSAITPLSLAIAGPLADAFGVRFWFVLGGAMCLLMGLVGAMMPVILNLDQQPAPALAGSTVATVPQGGAVPATAE